MADRVFLHIGAPKTGTTFIQNVLFANHGRLRRQGILVPGKNRFFHAAAAMGVRHGPGHARWSAWERLVERTGEWPGTVVISNEWLAMATEVEARRALEAFGPAELHVVFTARDPIEQVTAAWQEVVKDTRTPALGEFVEGLEGRRGRWRWSTLDAADVLPRWEQDLPPDRMHVVTVPPKGSGPSPLWDRFAHVCGIEEGSCKTDIGHTREGLGVEAARLMQILAPGLREALGTDSSRVWPEYKKWVEGYLAHEVLVPLGGSRIALRRSDARAVRKRGRDSARRLAESGYDIVGDLSDLTSATVPKGAKSPEAVSDADLLAVAANVIPVLLARIQQESTKNENADGVG